MKFKFKKRKKILILGPINSGKTSFQHAAYLSMSPTHKKSFEMVELTLDTTQPIHKSFFHISLIIDLPTLLNLKEDLCHQLTLQLKRLSSFRKKIPLFIIISKCDLLEGFVETFDSLEVEKRQHVLGINFSNEDRKKSLLTAFKVNYSSFINKIKGCLLKRMHHEQSLKKRQKIFAFSSKIGDLSAPLETLISIVPFNENFSLQGIYFTSISNQRNYFIHSLVDTTISAAKHFLSITKPLARLMTLSIAVLFIFSLTSLWHRTYHQAIQILNETGAVLTSMPRNTPSNLPWLLKFDILSKILENIGNRKIIPYQGTGLLQLFHLRQATKDEYRSLLKTEFAPYLQSVLLKKMELSGHVDQLTLFNVLKTYLSSSETAYYDKNIIMKWYLNYWKIAYPNQFSIQAKLQHHLFILLQSNHPLWKPNQLLIKQARLALQKMSLSELAFLELKGEYKSKDIPMLHHGKLEGISAKTLNIPFFYSSENFNEIFNSKIPNISKILAKGSWVLGNNTGKAISEHQAIKIASQVRSLYVQHYTKTWEEKISAIHLASAKNYSEVLQRINSLLNENSNLSQLIKLMVGNATLGNKKASQNLTTIKMYLNKKGRYSNVQAVLKSLKDEIQSIQQSDNLNKTSYLKARNRFEQKNSNDPLSNVFSEASKDPEPIRSWLITISMSTWTIMLKQTRNYLNSIWQNTVVPIYYNEIKHRFPIFKHSPENISLNNFGDFFGPNGMIGAFFINYLQPFVNLNQTYWTWKNLNGITLNIPQKILNSFIRASIIQQMFFTDDHEKPSFRFILFPATLSKNIKQFNLDMGGQFYRVSQQSNENQSFFWPASHQDIVSAEFISQEARKIKLRYHGPWAWFRMLQVNTLQTTANPKEFLLSLQANSHTIQFKVLAEHRINPMLPGIIGRYRCPDTL